MAFELKENEFYIFRNRNKQSDAHPDFAGDGLVNGKVMRIAIWDKQTKKGDQMFKMILSEKKEGQQGQKPPQGQQGQSQQPRPYQASIAGFPPPSRAQAQSTPPVTEDDIPF